MIGRKTLGGPMAHCRNLFRIKLFCEMMYVKEIS